MKCLDKASVKRVVVPLFDGADFYYSYTSEAKNMSAAGFERVCWSHFEPGLAEAMHEALAAELTKRLKNAESDLKEA